MASRFSPHSSTAQPRPERFANASLLGPILNLLFPTFVLRSQDIALVSPWRSTITPRASGAIFSSAPPPPPNSAALENTSCVFQKLLSFPSFSLGLNLDLRDLRSSPPIVEGPFFSLPEPPYTVLGRCPSE